MRREDQVRDASRRSSGDASSSTADASCSAGVDASRAAVSDGCCAISRPPKKITGSHDDNGRTAALFGRAPHTQGATRTPGGHSARTSCSAVDDVESAQPSYSFS